LKSNISIAFQIVEGLCVCTVSGDLKSNISIAFQIVQGLCVCTVSGDAPSTASASCAQQLCLLLATATCCPQLRLDRVTTADGLC
jgi:hypothetical protein